MKYNVTRTALIDADSIAYTLAAWAHGNQADALEMTERVEGQFADWMARSCCTHNIACFSCARDDNFRRDHYPLYKTNRTSEPPAMLALAQKVIRDCADRVVTIPRLEADDILGILATNGKIADPVCVGVDKDLRQIPGWHFNPDKEDFPVHVCEVQADYTFYQQWLTGDTTDGFGGIKGCGPKKAEKVLAAGADVAGGTHWEAWETACLEAYDKAGISLDDALAQARCARILRASDFESDNRVAIPWTPCAEVADNVGVGA